MAVNMLGYLGLSVSDMDKWEQYATEVLGMEISERASDGTVYLRMDENHHRIALYPTGKDDLVNVGLGTANRKQFEATKASLGAVGVEFQQATKDEIANRHVVDMIKFDLSGVPVEVYYGAHVVFEKPFVSPTGVKSFNTGIYGMGHVGIAVDDFPKAAMIAEEGLGFLLSDNLGGQNRFFHCNPREHTFVIGTRTDAAPKRMGHFMVEVNDINEVGFALQRVEERGIPITSRLGRHSNDHMLSFYHQTPSGFRIEYGTGGRLIDDRTWSVMKYKDGTYWRPALQAPATATASAAPSR